MLGESPTALFSYSFTYLDGSRAGFMPVRLSPLVPRDILIDRWQALNTRNAASKSNMAVTFRPGPSSPAGPAVEFVAPILIIEYKS